MLKVLSVFDVQSQSFDRPFFVPSIGVGTRMVSDEVNSGGEASLLRRHPEDFRLFELGEWDERAGVFQCHKLPVLVVDLVSLVAKA